MTDLEAGAAYFHFSCHSISTKLHPSFTYHISLPTSLLFCQFSLAWSKLLFLYEDSVHPPFKKEFSIFMLVGLQRRGWLTQAEDRYRFAWGLPSFFRALFISVVSASTPFLFCFFHNQLYRLSCCSGSDPVQQSFGTGGKLTTQVELDVI